MRYIRLQEPPRTRLRAREIARQIGVPPSEVLQVLADMGEYVRSAASYVEAPIIREVHERFGVKYAVEVCPSPPMEDSVADHQPRGLQPPTRRVKRDNHPLMGEVTPRRDHDASNDSDGASGSPRTASWAGRNVDQQWADLAGGDASHAFEFEEWKLRGFSELERDVWMAAGLRAGQARWAADLRDGGLSPTDLGVDLHGWRVVDRLQRGEGAAAVARLLTAMRASEAG